MSVRFARPRFASALLFALSTGWATTSEAQPPQPAEVDASSEPECPEGWYCAREREPLAEVVAPPPSLYPVATLWLRAGWVPMPEEASQRAALFSGGLGFRYRPSRSIGFEGAPNVVFGRDFLGRKRVELVLELSAVLSGSGPHESGPYVVVGPQLSIADVEGLEDTPVYAGGHLGFGLAWRVGARFALSAELDSYVQGRVDAGTQADYRDPLTGAASTATFGTALRAGLAFDL